MRGGMMSEWAASRTGQLSDIASQNIFGGYQGGHRPRWPIPPLQTRSYAPPSGMVAPHLQ
jgi:hypothetical protein